MGGSRQKKAQETSRTGVRLLNDGHMTNDDVGFMLVRIFAVKSSENSSFTFVIYNDT